MDKFLQSARDLIYLVACAVNLTQPDKARAEAMDLDTVYAVARKQSLCAAAAFALESAGISDARFAEAKAKSMRKVALLDSERARIFSALSGQGIWHMPLKGVLLKELYPAFGMREMSDNDVLCDPDRMADVRALMEELGYTCKLYEDMNHDIYTKAPSLCFEMHRGLYQPEAKSVFYQYYRDIKASLVPVSGSPYEYRFTPEEFYVYMLAHAYKHYTYGGTGLRTLLDIYVYRNAAAPDDDVVREKLSILGLTEFEAQNRRLATELFSAGEVREEDIGAVGYYLSSGTYGTEEQAQYNHYDRALSGDKTADKVQYFLGRMFLHGEALEDNYPFFYRHKILLPALYLYRPLRALFAHPGTLVKEVKDIKKFKKK